MESLSRSHSLRGPRRQRDLRSTAILRSASGTKLDALNNAAIVDVDDHMTNHQDIIHSDTKNQLHPGFLPNPGTEWKFTNFPATQILREINFSEFKPSKNVLFDSFSSTKSWFW